MYPQQWRALACMLALILSLFLVLLIAVSEATPPQATALDAVHAARIEWCAAKGDLAAHIAQMRDRGVPLAVTLRENARLPVSAELTTWREWMTRTVYRAHTVPPTSIRHIIEVACFHHTP